uniref:CYP6HM2 n=1 Tax=Apolygus lucorum TaxID=248454 RepID=A0A2D1BY32_APOLU|nr:CYP6HM2 [Apolygus lucorum]
MESNALSYVVQTILLTVTLLLFRKLVKLNFWKQFDIPFVEAPLPVIGDPLLFLKTPHIASLRLYKQFPTERFYGRYNLRKPTLVVRDPALVESVTIKDFSHMNNRNIGLDPDNNKLSKHLVNYRDEKWRALRNKLTPTFSSGKLKGMQPQLIKCAESLVKFLSNLKQGEVIDMKEISGRFAVDVVSSCAFGLDLDIINHPEENKFYEVGIKVFQPSYFLKYFTLLQQYLAPLFKKLRVRAVDKKLEEFFIDAIDKTVKYREENKANRQDFLQLLYDLKKKDDELLKKGEPKPLDDGVFDHTTLVSNAFIFLGAGYETTATTLGFLFYELAKQPSLQDKIYREVMTVLGKHGGNLTFDAVGELNYLDQVVAETLRMYPPLAVMDRQIDKDYQIPGTNVVLPAGVLVFIPVYGLQHDPQYFPEPDKFIPERFDPALNSVVKGSYVPFGSGPRMCIAARFATLEIKICVAMVMKHFKVATTPRTEIPIEFEHRTFVVTQKNGVWLSVEKRNE